MKRYRRLLSLLALFPIVAGCHFADYVKADPKEFPCGATGVVCVDTTPHTCCPGNNACATDDAGPYCAFQPFDPEDPAQWAMHKRLPRTASQ